jgi:outer membrane receptor protein involved in Fe transport
MAAARSRSFTYFSLSRLLDPLTRGQNRKLQTTPTRMKSEISYPMHRASKYLVACLAALVAVSAPNLRAASSDDLQKLQDENAALRKRLAQLEGNAEATPAAAPASATGQATSAPTAGSLGTDEGVQTLSPFQVNSDRDYGYLKTNSATATKIGMEIQKVPLNISVVSREFLDDTNARSITDLFRYSSSSTGDNRFAMRVPSNEATPQGSFTMRGFAVNNMMRDGIFRYSAYNLDNIERVEIVKGPASVFFGQGYPGGIINYITRRATFAKVPTTFTYMLDDNGGDKVKFDHNVVLSKKVAFRVIGAWEDTLGQYRYEYKKNFNVTPSLTVIPFESGKVKVNFDFEYLKERFNYNDYGWIYSDFAGWKDAAKNGTYGTSTATLANTVASSVGNNSLAAFAAYPLLVPGTNGTYLDASGNVVQSTNTPTVAYGTYINNKRTATGNLNLPAYTSVQRGGYYTDKSGNFIHDEHFNGTSRGSYADNEVKTATVSLEFTPFEWLSGRAAWVRDTDYYNNYGNSALTTPYADGVHWNVGLSAGGSGYYRETKTALVDLVFKYDTSWLQSKLLVGAQKADWRQMYLGKNGASDVNLAFLPGARNTVSNPDYAGTNVGKYAFGGVPVNQVIKDRNGVIKPVRQIYSNWDPGAEIEPDISVYWKGNDRNALDGYRPVLSSMYANYQGTLFNDRLTILTGYREEKRYERWQDQSNNFPWYIYPNDMPQNPAAYPEDVWGNSKAYQQTIPLDQKGRSAMAGASFAITKAVNLYTSWSKTFKFNSGNVGGFFPGPGLGDELGVYQSALNYGEGTHPGSYTYLGTLITSVAQAKAVMVARGAYANIKNETGKNIEFGGKISTSDNKIVGTVSVFRGERSNQKLDDPVATLPANEPYNSSTTLFAPGTYGYNTRNFRWRTTDLTNRVEGTEAEVIWTPIRNFQAVINGSWLWTAKTLDDKTHPKPGTARYNALSAAGQRDQNIYYNGRLENVPEYRFNFFGKYTLTDGAARGAAFGLGMRYSSKAVVARNVDWNPFAGGFQYGDYVVFDVTASYPWEVLGFKLSTTIGIYNATDKDYSDGGYVLSPKRNWLLTNTVRF